MRTLKQMASRKERQRKSRLLSFREFCDYVYEPTQMLKKLNLPEQQKKETEEAIKELM